MRALAVLFAWMLLAPGSALASAKLVASLGDGLPVPGALYDDVRAASLPKGQQIICESDWDKPKLANPGLMQAQRSRGADHVRRCSLFSDDGSGTWVQAVMPTAFGPARLWLIFIEQGDKGRYRLAQFSLWARLEGWDRAETTLSAHLGPATSRTDRFLGWQDAQHETQMFMDEKFPGDFAVAVGDIRLRKLMKSPGILSRE